MSVNKKVISAVIAILLALAAVVYFAQSACRNTPVVRVVRDWGPSVVNISTEGIVPLRSHPYWSQYGSIFDDLFKQYQSTTVGSMSLHGVGSGVVVSKDGLIVTNAHVVGMAGKIYVIFSDRKVTEAILVAINPGNDLALIKIDPPKKLKPVRLAKDFMIGETVISIGNPLGLENSASIGIISGTNRNINFQGDNSLKPAFTGLLQTDASINQGSSGGAIFNLDGELMGISLAVVQNAQSIGFAIPSGKIKSIMKDYEEAKAKRMSAR